MSTTSSSSYAGNAQFGDTTLTKVFVGGLAWETLKEALRKHFEQYGDILEAVIISDKLTGRSKGYGFVTFKEAEAAARACEDAAPVINGRRANCNLASLGAKRDKTPALASSPPPQIPMTQQGSANTNVVGGTVNRMMIPPASAPAAGASVNGGQVRWYYPAGATPYQPHHQHQAVPYYGFSPAPAYVAANMNYSQKISLYNGAFYGNGQLYPVPAGHQMTVYPVYQYHNQSTSFPAHVYPTVHRVPGLVPKTTTFVPPNPGAMVGV